MEQERYPGERRGLGLFLEDLEPVVERDLGRDSLLFHAIVQARRTSTLRALRHARRLFNALSRRQRQQLSEGIIAAPEPPPARDALLEDYGNRDPQPVVCFEAKSVGPRGCHHQMELRHELLEDILPVRVMIKPGTLPSAAAGCLRELAALIEKDRRLLSGRYWRAVDVLRVTENDTADFA